MTRRLLAIVAAAAAMVISSALPAWSCGCDSKPLDVLLAEADVVFSAITTSERGAEAAGPMRVDVERVYKGNVGETAEVWATDGPLACGISPADDLDGYIASDGERLTIGTCLPQHTVADIEEILGPGHDPATTVAVVASFPNPWLVAVVGGGIGLGSYLLRRRRLEP